MDYKVESWTEKGEARQSETRKGRVNAAEQSRKMISGEQNLKLLAERYMGSDGG